MIYMLDSCTAIDLSRVVAVQKQNEHYGDGSDAWIIETYFADISSKNYMFRTTYGSEKERDEAFDDIVKALSSQTVCWPACCRDSHIVEVKPTW